MGEDSKHLKERFLFPDMTLYIKAKRCREKIYSIKAAGGRITFEPVQFISPQRYIWELQLKTWQLFRITPERGAHTE